MKTINVGIIGAAGYTGGELLRLLIHHPGVHIAFAQSKSQAGKYWYEVHADLLGDTQEKFSPDNASMVDVCFLCMGHGEAKNWLNENPLPAATKVIDLSQDFRDQSNGFVYGLPEWQKNKIQQADKIANPGCFATAIQLALLPLAAEKKLDNIHITGITGATGAGQALSPTGHFAWRANNIQAYKSLDHQHLKEIQATLIAVQGNRPELNFIPWRGDFTRGIYLTATLECKEPLAQVHSWYQAFYQDHPFTFISEKPVDLKQVVNTNKCLISLEKMGDQLVVHTVIDNLLKGASGQAVQNMNLLFGLEETLGLKLKASAF
jgi:N-acetyl-gamma-glutamyl-phosphate reductase